MGAGMSRLASRTYHVNNHQAEMIKESLQVIQKDIPNIGVTALTRLFEVHPECKDVFFQFPKDLEKLQKTPEFRAHALSVMAFMKKVVASIHREDEVKALAFELGKKHYYWEAPPTYYGYFGEAFVYAVAPVMKEGWTPELEQAWKILFHYVTKEMKKGYQEENATPRQNTNE
ncbi:neuroglobin-like [Channa argus]|uniref:neuroglobin-like n=1 Tax=Channa argus TaxID=215402 RepID=UPI0029455AD9|nr:hypothetical protein Q8A73_017324 [Channa argus]